MNVYKINVKEREYFDVYTEFVVIGESINDMLENLYKWLVPDGYKIPYYLRSSNFTITNLGEITPKTNDKIISYNYISGDC